MPACRTRIQRDDSNLRFAHRSACFNRVNRSTRLKRTLPHLHAMAAIRALRLLAITAESESSIAANGRGTLKQRDTFAIARQFTTTREADFPPAYLSMSGIKIMARGYAAKPRRGWG